MTRQSPQQQLAHLSILNKRGRLALFVGAGVSFGCGLPTWLELIDRLANKAFPRATPPALQALDLLGPIPKTRLLKRHLGMRYKTALADCLYSAPYQLSPVIQRIAQAGIQRICTFNFDDLLEEAFATEGAQFDSLVAGDTHNNNFKGTTIFHPHGLLSSSMTAQERESASIVFSEEDYHALYSDPYSWSNLVQLSMLMNYTCLFVGMSLTDPNLRRLLDATKSIGIRHSHYAIMRSPSFAAPASELPLTKEIKRATESDLQSLRVQPIWVRRYEDAADIFKNIRAKRK